MDEQRYLGWLKSNGITEPAHLQFYQRAALAFEQEAQNTKRTLSPALVAQHVQHRRAAGLDPKKAGHLSQAGEVYCRFLTELNAAAKTAKPKVRPTLPDQVTLQPRSAAPPHQDRVDADIQALAAAGFEHVGFYTLGSLTEIAVHVVVHEGKQIVGAVIAHTQAGAWSLLIAKLEDGSTCLCSSLPFEKPLLPLDTHHSVKPGADVTILLQELALALGRKPRLPLSAKNATMVVENVYADHVRYCSPPDSQRVFG